jgi:hypothetical protein
MTSLVFIHGTGGRQDAYAETFAGMEQALQRWKPGVALVPCLWGNALGAKLNAGGASIPSYSAAQGGRRLSPEEESIRFWEALYQDPFYEMRLLGLRPLQDAAIVPGRLTPDQQLQQRVAALAEADDLRAQLDQLGIGQVFDQACDIITGPDSKPYRRLLETAPSNLSEDYAAIARAIVSISRILCKERGIYPWLLVNDALRDQAIDAIQQTLSAGEASMGVGDWVKGLVTDVALGFGTNKIQRQRGAIMDGAYPFAGDILIYQAKGATIRRFIRDQVLNAKVEPPVVLLAHSLGGVACVDLLIEADLTHKVAGLITVGSQAPFFYEIGALQTLPYGQPLPSHFPAQWLNIYDLRDFLSYVGNQPGIFPGRVVDVPVNNKQPFPEAHGAYWANDETWQAIANFLP